MGVHRGTVPPLERAILTMMGIVLHGKNEALHGHCMERMRTKVGGALPCAPTLMLQPWVEDRFESWCGRLADPFVVFLGGMGPTW